MNANVLNIKIFWLRGEPDHLKNDDVNRKIQYPNEGQPIRARAMFKGYYQGISD
jgi:hypothetical protein